MYDSLLCNEIVVGRLWFPLFASRRFVGCKIAALFIVLILLNVMILKEAHSARNNIPDKNIVLSYKQITSILITNFYFYNK